ncbi:hypothetical protein OUZ56_007021 [Daphnia magna]|uniref:Uncharacterized protein n=1 Tax=Daphnia magna TaxID=35525 RepID=A0ABQ9YYL4_9CRUS|nr:hypothetical protein OUZ56_007021 [Daphnia magna]
MWFSVNSQKHSLVISLVVTSVQRLIYTLRRYLKIGWNILRGEHFVSNKLKLDNVLIKQRNRRMQDNGQYSLTCLNNANYHRRNPYLKYKGEQNRYHGAMLFRPFRANALET